ncbi:MULTISPECIES: CHAP domain-containing protein [unclassified Leifsonia]|uniref:CHAP domain-containing protein n=1 Tax=unclassified Leifsonia TaxID=2663824 RepID=UPI0006F403C7|nr:MULTISPECIES: CHAP domain-containing protein [unclassified Leifsonia]KQX05673.1 hypothetical protein ASC59_16510 [Leifsonia sp. Root1293]KRA09309.1 hypothetical protein ASD61_16505 [Leifsonia sp. Root60]
MSGGIRRRTVIVAALGTVAAGAVGVALLPRDAVPAISGAGAGTPTPTPPPAPTRTIDEVRAEALGSAGMRLAASPWGPDAATATTWSTLYVSWLLRENAVPQTPDARELYEHFNALGQVGTEPRDGAVIFYSDGPLESIYHAGYVERASAGVVATVEGDVPDFLPHDQTFVRRYGQPWDSNIVFGYPEYVVA